MIAKSTENVEIKEKVKAIKLPKQDQAKTGDNNLVFPLRKITFYLFGKVEEGNKVVEIPK